jgi:2-polyprenyl-3-methyl-5-hydroxy-6-metoxy-1,4-benzoquinol methylase
MTELWKRLRYVLSPQFDIYECIAKVVRGAVADVGFGTGFGAMKLTEKADRVYGFEVDEQAIVFAQRTFPSTKLIFKYGDIERGIDGKFNFVVMIDVIEHISRDKLAIENAKKMLVPKGILICSTPNRLSRYRKSKGHTREYSLAEFQNLLKEVFPAVDVRNYNLGKNATQYDNPLVAVCPNFKKGGE